MSKVTEMRETLVEAVRVANTVPRDEATEELRALHKRAGLDADGCFQTHVELDRSVPMLVMWFRAVEVKTHLKYPLEDVSRERLRQMWARAFAATGLDEYRQRWATLFGLTADELAEATTWFTSSDDPEAEHLREQDEWKQRDRERIYKEVKEGKEAPAAVYTGTTAIPGWPDSMSVGYTLAPSAEAALLSGEPVKVDPPPEGGMLLPDDLAAFEAKVMSLAHYGVLRPSDAAKLLGLQLYDPTSEAQPLRHVPEVNHNMVSVVKTPEPGCEIKREDADPEKAARLQSIPAQPAAPDMTTAGMNRNGFKLPPDLTILTAEDLAAAARAGCEKSRDLLYDWATTCIISKHEVDRLLGVQSYDPSGETVPEVNFLGVSLVKTPEPDCETKREDADPEKAARLQSIKDGWR